MNASICLFMWPEYFLLNLLLIFHLLQKFMYFLTDILLSWEIFLEVSKMFYYQILPLFITITNLSPLRSRNLTNFVFTFSFSSLLSCLPAPFPTQLKWQRAQQSQAEAPGVLPASGVGELPNVPLWRPSPRQWYKNQRLYENTEPNLSTHFLRIPSAKSCLRQPIRSQELGLELLLYALITMVCVTYSFCLFGHLYQPQLLQEWAKRVFGSSDAKPETVKLFCHLAVQWKQHSSENKCL